MYTCRASVDGVLWESQAWLLAGRSCHFFHLLMGTGAGGSDGEAGAGQGNPDAQSILPALQTSQPTLETFQDLLHRHPDAFYLARTAKALQAHWQLMKQYYLLEDQTGNWAQDLAAWGVRMYECGGGWMQPPLVPCNILSGSQGFVHLFLQQKPLPSKGREHGWNGLDGKGSQNCLES